MAQSKQQNGRIDVLPNDADLLELLRLNPNMRLQLENIALRRMLLEERKVKAKK